jgi:hypothetical protein
MPARHSWRPPPWAAPTAGLACPAWAVISHQAPHKHASMRGQAPCSLQLQLPATGTWRRRVDLDHPRSWTDWRKQCQSYAALATLSVLSAVSLPTDTDQHPHLNGRRLLKPLLVDPHEELALKEIILKIMAFRRRDILRDPGLSASAHTTARSLSHCPGVAHLCPDARILGRQFQGVLPVSIWRWCGLSHVLRCQRAVFVGPLAARGWGPALQQKHTEGALMVVAGPGEGSPRQQKEGTGRASTESAQAGSDQG